MFWFRSLDIEIWDLFVIWCLGFGILRCIKPSFKYCRIYGGVTGRRNILTLAAANDDGVVFVEQNLIKGLHHLL